MNFQPDERGYWGEFGGRFVPETLMSPLEELTNAYFAVRDDADFQAEFLQLLKDFSGRPTPLFYAKRLSEKLGGAQIYLKREDLNHTGSHKINNVLGQVLMAKKMGKTRVIAETGAGQHGVATATAAASCSMARHASQCLSLAVRTTTSTDVLPTKSESSTTDSRNMKKYR